MARLDYYTPGVYVDEVSRGNQAIAGVNLSVAGFVGFTEDIRGDAEIFQPILITSWSQYLENFAKISSHGFLKLLDKNAPLRAGERESDRPKKDLWAYLPFSVKGWFENGGGRCWVVSLGTQLPVTKAEKVAVMQREPASRSDFTTVFTSAKKQSLNLRLQPEKEENGRVQVVIESDSPLPAEDANEDVFDSGEFFKITVIPKDDDPKTIRHLTMKDPDSPPLFETVLDEESAPESNSEVAADGESESEAQPSGLYVGNFQNNSFISSLGPEEKISDYIDIHLSDELNTLPSFPLARRPANGLYEVRPSTQTYEISHWFERMYGSATSRTGITGLFEVDDVAMVSCPDLMSVYQCGLVPLQVVHGVLEMIITNCESSSSGVAFRMAVIDPPPVKPSQGLRPVAPQQQKPQDIDTWRQDTFNRYSPYATLYYPWLKVANPADSGKPIMVPPSGHMMGLWCRTDESRGIHKAPANEIPRGIVGLAYETNFREQELLNPIGINCIRKFRNRGTLVWGARTLTEQADTENRYVSVRRLMSYIAKSIEEGTQWAVFEPNDPDLWARVTRTIKNFLERIWRQGALFGDVPEAAFYVKCDAELNPEETRSLGQLFVEVGVAPVKPAEFIIIRISQWNQSNNSV